MSEENEYEELPILKEILQYSEKDEEKEKKTEDDNQEINNNKIEEKQDKNIN